MATKEHSPRWHFDCERCKFNWCCGPTCACMLIRSEKLEDPPLTRQIEVNNALLAAGFSPEYPVTANQAGYKLLHERNDGTLGPLFINRTAVIDIGKWYKAKCLPTKGFAVRCGFHVLPHPHAPHLSTANRAWCVVEVKGKVDIWKRPPLQGGEWWTCEYMRVVRRLYASIHEVVR